jgi:hypothetical protein
VTGGKQQDLTEKQVELARLNRQIREMRASGVKAPRFSPARAGGAVIQELAADMVKQIQSGVGAKHVKSVNIRFTVGIDGTTIDVSQASVRFHGNPNAKPRKLSKGQLAKMQAGRKAALEAKEAAKA